MLTRAQQVLKELPIWDVVSWNALITGYAQEARVHEALHFLEWMQRENRSLDAITFICLL
jgi:pentatricopeptide repeat protein